MPTSPRYTLEEARRTLRATGLRATGARIAVLNVLNDADRPISHADVSEVLGDGPWDRTTIYRNLSDLVDAGLVRRTELGDRVWRFELVGPPDAPAHHHAHFVCVGCGGVECLPDVAVTMPDDSTAPAAVKRQQFEVQVRGLCDTCEPA